MLSDTPRELIHSTIRLSPVQRIPRALTNAPNRMKNTYTGTIVFHISLLALIQPCPAPPLLAVVPEAAAAGAEAGAAGAEAGAVGAEGGAAAAEGGAAGVGDGFAATGDAIHGSDTGTLQDMFHSPPRRREDSSSQNPQTSEAATTALGTCITDAMRTKQNYDLSHVDQGHVVVTGLPPSCMSQIAAWNAHPQTTQLEQLQGKMTTVNGSAIELDGLPEYTINAFKAKSGTGKQEILGYGNAGRVRVNIDVTDFWCLARLFILFIHQNISLMLHASLASDLPSIAEHEFW